MALKIPAIDLRADPALLRQFMMEEWIARRMTARTCSRRARPSGSDVPLRRHRVRRGPDAAAVDARQPAPEIETVRRIVEQLVEGLRALHRREMVHCDLRPENVMIDADGLVKIIDFGSTRVAGVRAPEREDEMLGTLQYSAPEAAAASRPPARRPLFGGRHRL